MAIEIDAYLDVIKLIVSFCLSKIVVGSLN